MGGRIATELGQQDVEVGVGDVEDGFASRFFRGACRPQARRGTSSPIFEFWRPKRLDVVLER
jgi:hypothetical protein